MLPLLGPQPHIPRAITRNTSSTSRKDPKMRPLPEYFLSVLPNPILPRTIIQSHYNLNTKAHTFKQTLLEMAECSSQCTTQTLCLVEWPRINLPEWPRGSLLERPRMAESNYSSMAVNQFTGMAYCKSRWMAESQSTEIAVNQFTWMGECNSGWMAESRSSGSAKSNSSLLLRMLSLIH